MATRKPRKRNTRPKSRNRKKPVSWYDRGNEIMDVLHNGARRLWKEATMRPDSWNQRAMRGVANTMEATVAIGAVGGHYAGKVAAPVIMAPVNATERGLEVAESRLWGRDDHFSGASRNDTANDHFNEPAASKRLDTDHERMRQGQSRGKETDR